jgi:hypothetical protein
VACSGIAAAARRLRAPLAVGVAVVTFEDYIPQHR